MTPGGDSSVTLVLTAQEALDVHHALATVVLLIDSVVDEQGALPAGAPLGGGGRERLILVAKRLDHERRHRGAVPNPNAGAPFDV